MNPNNLSLLTNKTTLVNASLQLNNIALCIYKAVFMSILPRQEHTHTHTDLVVIGDATVGRCSSDLWCGGPEVTRRHDARFSHAQAHDQIVTPQRNVAVAGACSARLLGIYWAAVRKMYSRFLSTIVIYQADRINN